MFLFPPHPNSNARIPPSALPQMEKQGGWIAQRKFNGWHSVIHLNKKENVCEIWHRSGKPFTKYRLDVEMQQCLFKGLHTNKDIVLNGELMHGQAVSKITGQQALTNTIILFDILYCDKPLTGMNFPERYELLKRICGTPKVLEESNRGLIVSKHGDSQLWLAEVFPDEFEYHFYEMYEFDKNKNDLYPEIEGLVLKRTENSRLQFPTQAYDVDWMMRVRKTKDKIYKF